MKNASEPVSRDQWVLIRNARQLLTLRGPSGPRCGPAMSGLGVVPNGAVLIRNDRIEEVGPARRIENLAGARKAREIDATGRIVLPGFVDADVALALPSPFRDGEALARDESTELKLMSRKRVLARAAAVATECTRYGTLAIGAQTRCAADLPNVRKVLRTHQMLQSKPVRIRSIYSPALPTRTAILETLTSRWLPAVIGKKLSSVVEISAGDHTASEMAMMKAVAVAASGLSYAIRLRSARALETSHLELAISAGAIALLAPMDNVRAAIAPLSALGCVRVIPASEAFDDAERAAQTIRRAIDEGTAVAVTSSYRPTGPSTLNMQYLLHLAAYKLGLTPEEAITATTWNPACSLRLSHVIGSLEPGKYGDLLIMDVPDYRELGRRAGHSDASLVMGGGQTIARSAALNSQ